jgi:hypothetical protein
MQLTSQPGSRSAVLGTSRSHKLRGVAVPTGRCNHKLAVVCHSSADAAEASTSGEQRQQQHPPPTPPKGLHMLLDPTTPCTHLQLGWCIAPSRRIPRQHHASMLGLCACIAGRPADADVAAAWILLKTFSLAQFKGLSQQYVATPTARTKLREALLVRCSAAACWAQLPVVAFLWNPPAAVTEHAVAGSMHGMRPQLARHWLAYKHSMQLGLDAAEL